MTNDVKYRFICLLAICICHIYSLVQIFSPLKNGLFVFFCYWFIGILHYGDKSFVRYKDFWFWKLKKYCFSWEVSRFVGDKSDWSFYYWQKFNSSSKSRILEENQLRATWDLSVTSCCVKTTPQQLNSPVVYYFLQLPGSARRSLRFMWCSLGSQMWLDVQDGFSPLTWEALLTRSQAGFSLLLHVVSLLIV